MISWKLPPALATGNTVVLKPAEQTPSTTTLLMEKIADVFPPGVINVVHGFGPEAGKPLASSARVDKVAFTGETTTGQLIMQYASKNLNPVTMELGGKSPNIFFNSVMDEDDAYLNKAIEGAVLFAFNQGEVCTCHQSRPCLGKLLPRLPRTRTVRRLQEVGLWQRNARDDAQPLSSDQKHAYLLRQKQIRFLLVGKIRSTILNPQNRPKQFGLFFLNKANV